MLSTRPLCRCHLLLLLTASNPASAIPSLPGVFTYRRKLKNRDEFDELERKTYAIIGGENMSYAPHFMPSYKDAFAHDPAAAALLDAGAAAADGGASPTSTIARQVSEEEEPPMSQV